MVVCGPVEQRVVLISPVSIHVHLGFQLGFRIIPAEANPHLPVTIIVVLGTLPQKGMIIALRHQPQTSTTSSPSGPSGGEGNWEHIFCRGGEEIQTRLVRSGATEVAHTDDTCLESDAYLCFDFALDCMDRKVTRCDLGTSSVGVAALLPISSRFPPLISRSKNSCEPQVTTSPPSGTTNSHNSPAVPHNRVRFVVEKQSVPLDPIPEPKRYPQVQVVNHPPRITAVQIAEDLAGLAIPEEEFLELMEMFQGHA